MIVGITSFPAFTISKINKTDSQSDAKIAKQNCQFYLLNVDFIWVARSNVASCCAS